jgi:hypothetical protein
MHVQSLEKHHQKTSKKASQEAVQNDVEDGNLNWNHK